MVLEVQGNAISILLTSNGGAVFLLYYDLVEGTKW